MKIEKFFKNYDYQEDTVDDDIRVTIDYADKTIVFPLSEWEKQPYYIIKSKINYWRVDVEAVCGGKTNLYIVVDKSKD